MSVTRRWEPRAPLAGPQAYWNTYGYDEHGNRDVETRHAVTASGTDTVRDYSFPPLASGQPHTLRGVAETGPSGASTETYGFDSAGRMTSRDGTQQTWDAEGHLRTSTTAGKTSTYLYDASGERLVRREPGKVTLYMGGTQLMLDTTTQQVSGDRIINLGGASAVRNSNGTISFVPEDHQGTGQWAIDRVSLAATERKLDPFGRLRGSPGTPWPAGKGFVGGDDDSSGLTHLGAREYDPETGSFISADPLLDLTDPDQMNGYGYAKNSPVTYSDASGLAPQGPTDNSVMEYRWNAKKQRNEPDASHTHTTNDKTGPGYDRSDGTGSGNPPSKKRPSEEEVRHAKEVKKQSLLDIIMTSGADILLEVTGIRDIQNCFTKGSVGACVNMVIGFIPWGKILKAGKILNALRCAFDAFMSHRRELAKAEEILAAAGSAATSCFRSFAGTTLVLMGDGSKKPIEDIKVGDKVVASDPETGQQSAHKVTKVFVHEDTLTDLKIAGETITTTEDHPFWSVTDQKFEEADELTPGEQVLTADNRVVTVNGLDASTGRLGLAFNLSIEGVHTYHVGLQAVLVHNTNACTIATKSNYRTLFTDAHPDMPSAFQVHHALPQKYAETMSAPASTSMRRPSCVVSTRRSTLRSPRLGHVWTADWVHGDQLRKKSRHSRTRYEDFGHHFVW